MYQKNEGKERARAFSTKCSFKSLNKFINTQPCGKHIWGGALMPFLPSQVKQTDKLQSHPQIKKF